MDIADLGPDYVPVLFELRKTEKDAILAQAARALLAGRSPAEILSDYARENSSDDLVIDPHFGAAPLGQGLSAEFSPRALEPEQSEWYVLRGFARRDASGRVANTIKGMEVQLHSDPVIGFALTRDTDHAVGAASDVAAKLDIATLAQHGLDGSGVAIAIVDTGIYLPHLTRELGAAPNLDVANSWTPPNLTTGPGMHRLGHGTMCAYGALIAAPKATLLDIADAQGASLWRSPRACDGQRGDAGLLAARLQLGGRAIARKERTAIQVSRRQQQLGHFPPKSRSLSAGQSRPLHRQSQSHFSVLHQSARVCGRRYRLCRVELRTGMHLGGVSQQKHRHDHGRQCL